MFLLSNSSFYSSYYQKSFKNCKDFTNTPATISQTELSFIPYNTRIYLDLKYTSTANAGYKQGNVLRMLLNQGKSTMVFPDGFFFRAVYMNVGSEIFVRQNLLTPQDDFFRIDGYNSSIATSLNQFIINGFIFWD